jgi:hypothetical protein
LAVAWLDRSRLPKPKPKPKLQPVRDGSNVVRYNQERGPQPARHEELADQ